MARIAGINLQKEKRIEAGLTAIFGIGRKLSAKILEEANIDKNKKVQDLDDREVRGQRTRCNCRTKKGKKKTIANKKVVTK